jgi:hypothetical protein
MLMMFMMPMLMVPMLIMLMLIMLMLIMLMFLIVRRACPACAGRQQPCRTGAHPSQEFSTVHGGLLMQEG